MSTRTSLLYVAPGAGLGHLTRACAILLELRALGVEARGVTWSRYAEDMEQLTGCRLDRLSRADWEQELDDYLIALEPRLVCLDTFPWGLQGEWAERRRLRYALIARRLKLKPYLNRNRLLWDPSSPMLERVLMVEPLSADYEARLRSSAGEVYALNDFVRLPLSRLEIPVPPGLEEALAREGATLVVHSGPELEVQALVQLASLKVAEEGRGHVLAIVPERSHGGQEPWGRLLAGVPRFAYFPAARLFARAHRVITAGGYNCVAEGSVHLERWQGFPFYRHFDDQLGRLEVLSSARRAGGEGLAEGDGGEGAREAARQLAKWL